MSLEQLSYFSQTIAAVAVVVSLIYAALQVRTYAKATLDARLVAAQSDLQEFRRMIATNFDCARIYRDGLADLSKLDSADQWRFGALMQMIVTNFDYAHRFSDVYHGEADPAFALILRRPGFLMWWREGRSYFTSPTVALVDELCDGGEFAPKRRPARS